MSSRNRAVVRKIDNVITNRIVADDDFLPEEGFDLIDDAGWEIGGTLVNGVYTPPPPRVLTDEENRRNALVTDPGQTDLINRLRTATPAQIDNWIETNVTTIAGARAVLKALAKVQALNLRD